MRHSSVSLIAMMAVAGAGLAGAGRWPAGAQSPQGSADDGQVIIVMDSSGSMWGQIEGVSKRDIARGALRKIVGENPELASAGLIAYGHRRKGDCGDIEVLRAPGGDGELPALVDGLKPVGKTPLTAAVQQAAEALKFQEGKATVVLITDGIETCEADPCAAAAELEALGVDFTAHVIGFGLSEAEGRQVACIAEVTGGVFIAASDAGSLNEALATVAGSVEETPPAYAESEATIDGPGSAVIGSDFEVAFEGPDDKGDYVDIVPAGYEPTFGELSYGWTKDGSPATLRAPAEPGEYELRYIWVAPQGRVVLDREPIEIVDSEFVLLAPPEAQVGSAIAVEWKGPGNKGDYVDLVPAGFGATSGELSYDYVEDGVNPALVRAPSEPGDYEIRYVAQGGGGRVVTLSVPLTVTEANVGLSFDPDAVVGGTIEVDWSGPDGQGDYVDIVPRGFTNTSGELSYAYTSAGNPAVMTLPVEAGAYDVRYVLQGAGGRRVMAVQGLTLQAAEASLAPAAGGGVAGSNLQVTWTGPDGKDDYVDIVPRGYTETYGEIGYFYTKRGNPSDIRLPAEAGEYELRYVLQGADGRRVLVSVPLTVTAE